MYKTLLLSFLLTLSLTQILLGDSQYKAWKKTNGITYKGTEDRYRVLLFKQAEAKIKAHNRNPRNTYKKGLNQFSGMTFKEFEELYLMKNI